MNERQATATPATFSEASFVADSKLLCPNAGHTWLPDALSAACTTGEPLEGSGSFTSLSKTQILNALDSLGDSDNARDHICTPASGDPDNSSNHFSTLASGGLDESSDDATTIASGESNLVRLG